MEQMTVKELAQLCREEIKKGSGDKYIVVGDDNEGNGYHGLFYGFTPMDEDLKDMVYDSVSKDENSVIVLG